MSILVGCGKNSQTSEPDIVRHSDPLNDYLNRDRNQNNKPSAPPAEQTQLDPTRDLDVQLTDASPDIRGYVENKSKNTYKYVEIRYDFLDKDGVLLGNGLDNVNNLGPGEKWSYRIPAVGGDRYDHARLVSVTGN